jgi:hypothetical protein
MTRPIVTVAASVALSLVSTFCLLRAQGPAAPEVAARAESSPASEPEQGDPGRRLEREQARLERLTTKALARIDEVEQFRDELADQQVGTAKAVAAARLADAEREVADLALKEYEQGTYPQELDLIDAEIAAAEADLRMVEEHLNRRDRPPGPPSPSREPVEIDERALPRAKLALTHARRKREALMNVTRPKRLAELKKEAERARAEAEIKTSVLDLERADQRKLERQLREGALLAEESREFALIDEAAGLAARLQGRLDSARSPGDRAEVQRLAGRLAATLDRAQAAWDQAERSRKGRVEADSRLRLRRAAGGKVGRE